jgi:phospholipid/cholesterol/gamma-HCH transport system permease protein
MAHLPATAVRAVVEPRGDSPAEATDRVGGQLSWMFGMGIPLVALVHVGMGSFLAMQSYFGGTFAEGTGAVVGVGLLRNVAPLLAGLTLAGLVAARMTPELRHRVRAEGVPLGGRAIASRLIAATIAGPVLSVWAAAVGTLVGWQVAQTLIGVTTHSFFHMFWEMLWIRDLTGVIVKGLCYGFFAGLFACHEGLLVADDDDLATVSAAACRAACFASIAILIVNSAYFILGYHAGPAFGPTLLEPPGL